MSYDPACGPGGQVNVTALFVKRTPEHLSHFMLVEVNVRQKRKRPEPDYGSGPLEFYPGGDLRSHTVARAVSSAQRGLTSVFGMGTGVTLAV